MKIILSLLIFSLFTNNSFASENWTVEKILGDKFISVSTFGIITHGDRYRLLIKTEGDCSKVEETFTIYTAANHPKISKIENKKIAIEYNDQIKLGNILTSSKFLMGHTIFVSTGLIDIDKHIASLNKKTELHIKVVGVIDNVKKKTGWKAEEMFDIAFNSWNLKGISEALKKGQQACLNSL